MRCASPVFCIPGGLPPMDFCTEKECRFLLVGTEDGTLDLWNFMHDVVRIPYPAQCVFLHLSFSSKDTITQIVIIIITNVKSYNNTHYQRTALRAAS